MSQDPELPVFALLGEAGLTAIVHGFYQRVPLDPILGALYPPHDLAGAEARLRAFLIYRFGGPPDYLRERGHPRLRMRHMPFAIDQAARDRWLALMMESVREQDVARDLSGYLERFIGDIATFLINR